MEITENLRKLDELTENRDNLESLFKETKAQIRELEEEICTDAQNEFMPEMTLQDDKGQKAKYKMDFNSRFFVVETNSDHSKKVDLYRRLVELTGQDDKFQFFETANVNANTFKSIMKKLPHEVIEKFLADGLIYMELKPEVSKRKVK